MGNFYVFTPATVFHVIGTCALGSILGDPSHSGNFIAICLDPSILVMRLNRFLILHKKQQTL